MNQTKKDIATGIVIAAFILLWPRIRYYISYTRPPEFDDGEIDEAKEDPCEHVIYQPLSLAGLHTSDILPKGYCYRGDSFWDNKPHKQGDAYADDQADEVLDLMSENEFLDKMDYLVLNLENDTDAALDFDVVNATTDPQTWGAAIPSIVIVTTTSSPYDINLAGTGVVTIDWGDGTVESETLGALTTYTHNYTAGGTIIITGVENITEIKFKNDSDVTEITIPAEATALLEIDVSSTSITEFETHAEWASLTSIDSSSTSLTEFTTHVEWVNLSTLNLSNTSISVLTTYAEWVNLSTLNLSNTSISVLTTYAEWVNLAFVSLASASITTFTTHPEWVNLVSLSLGSSPLTALITRPEWVNLNLLDVSGTSVNSLNTYATWANLTTIDISGNSINSLATHPEWVNLRTVDIGNTSISTFTTHPEWVDIRFLFLGQTSLSALTTYAAWTEIRIIDIDNTTISTLTTYAAWVNLTTLVAQATSITNMIAHSAWTSLSTFNVVDNAIVSATNINNALIAIDATGITSGNITMNGGTNAAPTGAGITAASNLSGRGVSVLTN
jgi:multidrug transporter EmrE-like cation transporter